eukprot:61669-Prymnesium_polylepis.1
MAHAAAPGACGCARFATIGSRWMFSRWHLVMDSSISLCSGVHSGLRLLRYYRLSLCRDLCVWGLGTLAYRSAQLYRLAPSALSQLPRDSTSTGPDPRRDRALPGETR